MLYKLIVIIILLILFYLLMSNNIETFIDIYDNDIDNNNKNNKDGKNYINKNEYSWDRFNINSSIPYDIIIKNDKND